MIENHRVSLYRRGTVEGVTVKDSAGGDFNIETRDPAKIQLYWSRTTPGTFAYAAYAAALRLLVGAKK